MRYIGYSRCSCGAITITTDEGEYSCLEKNRLRFFPGLDLRRLRHYPRTFCCNHCVNHYGLDLCGCGSGEPFGKCDAGLDACAVPMQVLGQYQRVRAANALN